MKESISKTILQVRVSEEEYEIDVISKMCPFCGSKNFGVVACASNAKYRYAELGCKDCCLTWKESTSLTDYSITEKSKTNK